MIAHWRWTSGRHNVTLASLSHVSREKRIVTLLFAVVLFDVFSERLFHVPVGVDNRAPAKLCVMF